MRVFLVAFFVVTITAVAAAFILDNFVQQPSSAAFAESSSTRI